MSIILTSVVLLGSERRNFSQSLVSEVRTYKLEMKILILLLTFLSVQVNISTMCLW